MVLKIILIYIMAVAASAIVESRITSRTQKFTLEPRNKTVLEGSEVLFSCVVANHAGVLYWTKDDKELNYLDLLREFKGRYSMSMEENEYSTFHLKISPVTLADEGKFQCRITKQPPNQPETQTPYATLTVLVFPDSPEILQGKSLITTEFKETELECVSRAGKPVAEITWMDSHGNVLKKNIKEFVEPVSDGKRFTVRSVLKLVPQKHHNCATFTCLTENAADRLNNRSIIFRSVKLKLNVTYTPRVSLKIMSGITKPAGWIPEGVDVILLCQGDGNPTNMNYKWFVNHKFVPGISGKELAILNVSRKSHEAHVKCTVQNQVGMGSSFVILNVTYGPRFISGYKIIEAELGAKETLTCDVEGNPPPNIVWFHGKTRKIVGASANLTLIVDNDSLGSYYCRASSANFSDIEMNLALIIIKNRPPVISHLAEFEVPGGGVYLECIVVSISPISNISWTFEGAVIDSLDKDYSIFEKAFTDGIKSTLLIHKPELKHFGTYNCSAANSYSTSSEKIVFKAPRKFLVHHIFKGGIAAVVLLLIILIIVLFIKFHPRFFKKPLNQVECNGDKEFDWSSNESEFENLKSEASKARLKLACIPSLEINTVAVNSEQLPSSLCSNTFGMDISTHRGNPYNSDQVSSTKFASLPPRSNFAHIKRVPKIYNFSVKFS